MSNCYTTFYFELPLPNPAVAQEVETLLGFADDYWDKDEDAKAKTVEVLSPVFEEFGEYEELGFDWETRSHGTGEDLKTSLVVWADESGNTSHAGELIEWLLPKLDIDGAGFEFAYYGDGENGGGAQAFLKTADGIKCEYVSTTQWLVEKMG